MAYSSTLTHIVVVTWVHFSLFFLGTAVVTGRICVEVRKAWNNSGPRQFKPRSKTVLFSLLICFGFLFGLPLQCVQLTHFDMCTDKARRKEDTESRDLYNWPLLWAVGVPGGLCWFGAMLCTLLWFISKLNIFEQSAIKVKQSRIRKYYIAWTSVLLAIAIWCVLYGLPNVSQLWFALYTLLFLICSLTFLSLLTLDFTSRLTALMRMRSERMAPQMPVPDIGTVLNAVASKTPSLRKVTSKSYSSERVAAVQLSAVEASTTTLPVASQLSLSVSTSEVRSADNDIGGVLPPKVRRLRREVPASQLSKSDQKMLEVVTRQTLLTLTIILALLTNAIFFSLIINAKPPPIVGVYMRIFVTQVGFTLPLCIFLSFKFSGKYYPLLCGKCHNRLLEFDL